MKHKIYALTTANVLLLIALIVTIDYFNGAIKDLKAEVESHRVDIQLLGQTTNTLRINQAKTNIALAIKINRLSECATIKNDMFDLLNKDINDEQGVRLTTGLRVRPLMDSDSIDDFIRTQHEVKLDYLSPIAMNEIITAGLVVLEFSDNGRKNK